MQSLLQIYHFRLVECKLIKTVHVKSDVTASVTKNLIPMRRKNMRPERRSWEIGWSHFFEGYWPDPMLTYRQPLSGGIRRRWSLRGEEMGNWGPVIRRVITPLIGGYNPSYPFVRGYNSIYNGQGPVGSSLLVTMIWEEKELCFNENNFWDGRIWDDCGVVFENPPWRHISLVLHSNVQNSG